VVVLQPLAASSPGHGGCCPAHGAAPAEYPCAAGEAPGSGMNFEQLDARFGNAIENIAAAVGGGAIVLLFLLAGLEMLR
jgi:hypothetical protein